MREHTYFCVLFPTEVSSFDFQVECTDRTVQYKLNAQSLRLFGLHRDVKTKNKIRSVITEQSQICVKNTNPAMLEQGDLYW